MGAPRELQEVPQARHRLLRRQQRRGLQRQELRGLRGRDGGLREALAFARGAAPAQQVQGPDVSERGLALIACGLASRLASLPEEPALMGGLRASSARSRSENHTLIGVASYMIA